MYRGAHVEAFIKAIEAQVANSKPTLDGLGLACLPMEIDNDQGRIEFGIQDPTAPSPNVATCTVSFLEIRKSYPSAAKLFSDLVDDVIRQREERANAPQEQQAEGKREDHQGQRQG